MGVCHGKFKAPWHPGALRWLNGDVPMQFHRLRSRLRSGCNMLQLRPYNPWAQEDSPYHPRLVAYLAIPPWQHLPLHVVPCTSLHNNRTPEDPKYKDIPKNKLPLAEFARHVDRAKYAPDGRSFFASLPGRWRWPSIAFFPSSGGVLERGRTCHRSIS